MIPGIPRYRQSWRSLQREIDGSISLREVVEAATAGTRRRLTAVENRLKHLDGVTAEIERLAQIIAELERTIALAALRGKRE